MTAPPRWLKSTCHLIDTYVGEWPGRLVALLIFPLIFVVVYEVIARYAFHAPTMWAFDMTYMMYGSHFMLGAAYTLLKGQHIRTDLFYERWSTRRKGIVDATLYLLFFFPGMLFFLIAGFNEAVYSWSLLEQADSSPWRPIIYPFKTVLPVTAALLIIQGISEFLKSGYAALTGKAP